MKQARRVIQQDDSASECMQQLVRRMSNTVLVCPDAQVDEADAKQFIRELCGDDSFEWNVDNKYYKAVLELQLVSTDSTSYESPAIVFLASPADKEPSSASVSQLEALAKQSEWDISIVCHASQTLSASEDAWDDVALRHGFEYVRPTREQGMARIKEALQAHAWSTPSSHEPHGANEKEAGFEDDFAPFQSAQTRNDDDDEDDFEALFAQVAALRNADVSMDERRDRAEAIMRRLLADDFD